MRPPARRCVRAPSGAQAGGRPGRDRCRPPRRRPRRRQARDQRAVRRDDPRDRALVWCCDVRLRHVDRVLERAQHERLLVVGVRRVAPARRSRAVVRPDVVRDEDHLGAGKGERARDLRVAEGLVADRDPEGHARRLEDAPAAPGTYYASSSGSICVFAWTPSREPSAPMTYETISRPASPGRSAPTIATTPAWPAAAATSSSAASSWAVLTSATSLCPRCPGSPVSGRQTIRASRRPASSTAATAAGTASVERCRQRCRGDCDPHGRHARRAYVSSRAS